MKKKLLALFMVFAVALALVACDDPTPPAPEKFTVTFDTQGGTAVPSQEVEKGQLATRPANDPTKAGDAEGCFNWFTTDRRCSIDFSKAIEANVTVYAQWTESCSTVTLCLTLKKVDLSNLLQRVGGQVKNQLTY